MNSTALRAPSRLSLTALLFGLLLPFGALAEEAAPTAQPPGQATPPPDLLPTAAVFPGGTALGAFLGSPGGLTGAPSPLPDLPAP